MVGKKSVCKYALLKIGFYYLAILATITVLSIRAIGTREILVGATKFKPYSILKANCSSQDIGQGTSNVLCFGDSNSFWPPDLTACSDNFDVHLPGLIRNALEGEGLERDVCVSEWAFPRAGMFDYYCLFYRAQKFSPDLLIVPINWQFFGYPWEEGPDGHHPELSAFVPLRPELNSAEYNPLRARGISPVKHVEYKLSFHTLYRFGIKAWVLDNKLKPLAFLLARTVVPMSVPELEPPRDEFGPEKLAADPQTLGLRFPMHVEKSNLTLREVQALAQAASQRGTGILFFIWPLNYERFSESGILDRLALEHSISRIRQAARGRHVYFADLSDLLAYDHFVDIYGHCTVDGRRKIAAALVPTIREALDGRPPSLLATETGNAGKIDDLHGADGRMAGDQDFPSEQAPSLTATPLYSEGVF